MKFHVVSVINYSHGILYCTLVLLFKTKLKFCGFLCTWISDTTVQIIESLFAARSRETQKLNFFLRGSGSDQKPTGILRNIKIDGGLIAQLLIMYCSPGFNRELSFS